ncbi:MAG: hypothetical protein IKS20_03025 [Victivallales bacterium]|nr:hypothetical protein [Victivallales bacterium]
MSLSDVQHALSEELGIRMTYLDLRMLAATLPVEWEKQDKKVAKPAPVEETPQAEEAEEAETDEAEDEAETEEAESEEEGGDDELPDTVLTLDDTPMPGAALSGTVRFMSGISCGWFMDRMGRLGFNLPDDAKEQPTDDDVQAFQVELQKMMQKRAEEMRKAAFDGTTKVDISPITRPGCDINGTVTFSSGAKGEWMVAQGKLDFDLDEGSSQPTRDDFEKFRLVLAETMRSKGYR